MLSVLAMVLAWGTATGFLQVNGGSGFSPQAGQALTNGTSNYATQLRLRRVSDGAYWNDGDQQFQPSNFFTDETK